MLILSLIFVALGVGADQVVKYLVIQNLKPDGTLSLIPGLLDITYVENTGVAFGMLPGYLWIMVAVTSVFILIMLGVLIFYRKHTALSRLSMILIIAGGIGNLIDRLVLGYVVDYIQVSFFPPVFNLADCFVVVGVILLLVYVIFCTGKDDGREYVIRSRR